jgi:hypothetical protein
MFTSHDLHAELFRVPIIINAYPIVCANNGRFKVRWNRGDEFLLTPAIYVLIPVLIPLFRACYSARKGETVLPFNNISH